MFANVVRIARVHRFVGPALPCLIAGVVLLSTDAALSQQLFVQQTGAQCAARGGYIITWTSSAPGVASAIGRPQNEGKPPVGECYVPPQITSSPPRSYTAPNNGNSGSGGGGSPFLNGFNALLNFGIGIAEMNAQREAQEQYEREAFENAQKQAAMQQADFLFEAAKQHRAKEEWGAALRAYEAAANALPSDDFENAAMIKRHIGQVREKIEAETQRRDAEAKRQQAASVRSSVINNLPPRNPFPASPPLGVTARPDGTIAGGPVAPAVTADIKQACRGNPNPSMCELVGMVDASQKTRATVNMPFNCGHARGEWIGDTVNGFCQLPGQPARSYSTAGKAEEYAAKLRADFRNWEEVKPVNPNGAADRIAENIRSSLAMIMLSTASMDPDEALKILRDITPLVQKVAGYEPPDRFALPRPQPQP